MRSLALQKHETKHDGTWSTHGWRTVDVLGYALHQPQDFSGVKIFGADSTKQQQQKN